nr:uncharacterized protein LOC111427013 [Onthophagus taurus]
MKEITINRKCKNLKLIQFTLFLVLITISNGFPANHDEDMNNEIISPNSHQFLNWIVSVLRKNDFLSQPSDIPLIPYQFPPNGKRNSAELTSSIMAIPRTIIDNGK